MKVRLFWITLCAAVASSLAISTADGPSTSSPIERVDSTEVSGYYLDRIFTTVFSPVIDPQFSIPHLSTVTVFLTDTLLTETSYVAMNELLEPGRYRVDSSPLSDYRRTIGEELFFLHLACNSVSRREGLAHHVHSYTARSLVFVP